MQLIQRNAPHIRHSDNPKTLMGDMILTLLPLYVLAICFYGFRVLITMTVSVLSCWLCDMLCSLLRRRFFNFRDLSSIVTGLIIPLVMPATVPYYVVLFAGMFAICAVKHPFGGTGENLFNPAAGGIAFAAVCWPAKVFAYPVPFTTIPLWDTSSVLTVTSTAHTLKMGGLPSADLNDMVLGLVAGPVGAVSILVLLACLVYLSIRRTIPLVQPVCFLAAAALMAFAFPRADISRAYSVLYELMSGSLMFGAVFMLNDPVTSPKRTAARAIYGFAAGIVTMLFRYFGAFDHGFAFALLIMNALAEEFDYFMVVGAPKLFGSGRKGDAA
ncbi:MAG: RnfABCDGE type electron transport complex subunit D [Oscillospiraceae bacterium]|nr:RnfABCDGE type electron transport complex subunit D [Oscillospiraceae bacterium]